MTAHIHYEHKCASCGFYYLPYDKDVACPKCGLLEVESRDIFPQLVNALESNKGRYGHYQPPAFAILTVADHFLNLMARILDHFEEEKGNDFPHYVGELSRSWDVGDEENIREYIKTMAVRVKEALHEVRKPPEVTKEVLSRDSHSAGTPSTKTDSILKRPLALVEVIIEVPSSADGIWPLIRAIPPVLERLAPERIEEISHGLDGLKIRFSNEDAFIANASSTLREIKISRGLVECIWCASFAYLVFLREIQQQMEELDSTRKQIVLEQSSPQVASALRALRAATIAASQKQPVNWDSLPTPVPPGPCSSESNYEEQAGELTLVALGFILYHELAHIVLEHTPAPDDPDWTLDQEKDADNQAIAWILDNLPPEQAFFVAKRAWGVIIATAFLTATKVNVIQTSESPDPNTHPQPYDRLDNALNHRAVLQNELTRNSMITYACAALVPQIRLAQLPLGDGPFEDWEHLYQHCLNILSEHLKR